MYTYNVTNWMLAKQLMPCWVIKHEPLLCLSKIDEAALYLDKEKMRHSAFFLDISHL